MAMSFSDVAFRILRQNYFNLIDKVGLKGEDLKRAKILKMKITQGTANKFPVTKSWWHLNIIQSSVSL